MNPWSTRPNRHAHVVAGKPRAVALSDVTSGRGAAGRRRTSESFRETGTKLSNRWGWGDSPTCGGGTTHDRFRGRNGRSSAPRRPSRAGQPPAARPTTPYVLDRSPCGSSSGSAVAAATSLAAVTIGTETDGSIVRPSSVNSAVGVKPSLIVLSRRGIVPITARHDSAGPTTRNDTDAALNLWAIGGTDPADPDTVPQRVRPG
ncbi:amidase family protein [Streptomyces sp. NPDC097617]|uniref:amidase family protein n=1 Tax=Streptomyces sp. NPDC097617 TaxID=3366091 RepID=UPI0038053951